MKLRLLIFAVLAVFVGIFVHNNVSQLEQIPILLLQAKVEWIVFAVLAQVCLVLINSEIHRKSLVLFGIKATFWQMIPLVLGSTFLNTVVPSGGASGASLFVTFAKRTSQSKIPAAVAVFAIFWANLTALFVLLIFSLRYLLKWQQLNSFEILGAILLTGSVILFTAILGSSLLSPRMIEKGMFRLLKLQNKIPFRPTYSSEQLHQKIDHYHGELLQIHQMFKRPHAIFNLFRLINLGVLYHLTNIITLWLVAQAFLLPLTWPQALVTYTFIFIFWLIAITPQGLGSADAIGYLLLLSFALSEAQSVTLMLAFRSVSFWLPLIVGFFSYWFFPTLIKRKKITSS